LEQWKLQPARDLGLSQSQRMRSLRRESGLIETGLYMFWWALIRSYLRIGHRLEVRGKEHLPAGPPFVLVANHGSHLDALTLFASLPCGLRDRVFPLAAGDAFFEATSTAAFAAFLLNALPLWRRRCNPRDIAELRRRLLDEPCAYILFPEGTRTRTGSMGPFKGGLGILVAGTDVPVVPCHLEGTFRAWRPDRRLPTPGRKITLSVGPPLRFSAMANDRDGWTEVAAAAEASVRSLAPVPPPTPSAS